MPKFEINVQDINVQDPDKFNTTSYPSSGFFRISTGEVVFNDGACIWVPPAFIMHLKEISKKDIEEVKDTVTITENGLLKLVETLHNKPK